MAAADTPQPSKSLLDKLDAWGSNPLPAIGMATLISSLHLRPLRPLPLLLVPALLFSSYANVAGYVIDAAGTSAAFSGLYALLALRRRQPASLRSRLFSARGLVRGTAIGLGAVNCAAGTATYLTRDRAQETAERRERNRWGNQA